MIEDIDIIKPHALQALIQTGQQIFAASPVTVRPLPHIITGLRTDDQFITVGGKILF